MSEHPPTRLRIALAFLILAVAGTVVGAAFVLGTDQDAPTTVAAELPPTGPPLVLTDGVEQNPTAAETAAPGVHLRVLDHQAAIRQARAARAAARRQAEELAHQQAILEYAARLADAHAAQAAASAATTPDPAPAPLPDPTPAPPPATTGGGGGGGGGGANVSMSEKLDNIAQCESGGNPQAVSSDHRFQGAWQFLRETWDRLGGGPHRIVSYSYAEQKVVAQRLAESDGWDSWPTCAARLGYI